MEPQTGLIIFLFFLTGLACAIVLAGALWCRRRISSLNSRIDELSSRVRVLESRSGAGDEKQDRPGPALRSDQLSARFQRADEMAGPDVSAKYRHVARLARSGLGAAELSEILDVSQTEAQQMLVLARSAAKST